MDAKALVQRIAAARRRRPDGPHVALRIRSDEVESLLKSLRHYLEAARCREAPR